MFTALLFNLCLVSCDQWGGDGHEDPWHRDDGRGKDRYGDEWYRDVSTITVTKVVSKAKRSVLLEGDI